MDEFLNTNFDWGITKNVLGVLFVLSIYGLKNEVSHDTGILLVIIVRYVL